MEPVCHLFMGVHNQNIIYSNWLIFSHKVESTPFVSHPQRYSDPERVSIIFSLYFTNSSH